ncbi:MAG: hypothetical protein IJH50_07105 [Kiritimatiellae bacterium]|nr:hypothetical protein [Kiritimatiellia bacterium]
MDRTVVKMTTLKEQDEAFCLSLSIDERLKVLEELNRIGRLAVGSPDAPLDRQKVHAA